MKYIVSTKRKRVDRVGVEIEADDSLQAIEKANEVLDSKIELTTYKSDDERTEISDHYGDILVLPKEGE